MFPEPTSISSLSICNPKLSITQPSSCRLIKPSPFWNSFKVYLSSSIIGPKLKIYSFTGTLTESKTLNASLISSSALISSIFLNKTTLVKLCFQSTMHSTDLCFFHCYPQFQYQKENRKAANQGCCSSKSCNILDNLTNLAIMSRKFGNLKKPEVETSTSIPISFAEKN